jgi:hypothetical protein
MHVDVTIEIPKGQRNKVPNRSSQRAHQTGPIPVHRDGLPQDALNSTAEP